MNIVRSIVWPAIGTCGWGGWRVIESAQFFSFAVVVVFTFMLSFAAASGLNRDLEIRTRKLFIMARTLFSLACLLRFDQNKPYFAGMGRALLDGTASHQLRNWNFNVSHHGKYVAIASEPVCLVSDQRVPPPSSF